jgi:hypothetical protein
MPIILWRTGVSALTAIKFPIIIQVVPAYIVGLYATKCGEIHPWSLTIGACKTIVDNHTVMLFVFDVHDTHSFCFYYYYYFFVGIGEAYVFLFFFSDFVNN